MYGMNWVSTTSFRRAASHRLTDHSLIVWVTTLCATVFHAQAVHTSYQTYLQSQGGGLAPITIGPFTILPTITRHTSTPVLPTASRQRSMDEQEYDRLMTATPDLDEESIYRMDASMIVVSPPTPSSPTGEYAYPTLHTPGPDGYSSPRIQAEAGETPSRPGAFRKISGEWFGRRPSSEDDVERGKEMVGLGMGLGQTDVRL